MPMIYELWDVESGNRLERFDSEAAALRATRELLDLNGLELLDALSLGVFMIEDAGRARPARKPIEGEELLTRIRALDPPPPNVAAAPAKQRAMSPGAPPAEHPIGGQSGGDAVARGTRMKDPLSRTPKGDVGKKNSRGGDTGRRPKR